MLAAVSIFVAILIGLVIVHELGHFAVAKLFGIRVEEFGIFFPPRLFAVRRGETEYSLNAIPLGGFVRILGESGEETPAQEQAPEQNARRVFSRRARPVQVAVVVAGIVMNLLAAWLLLAAGYMVGLPTPVEHVGLGQVAHAQATVVSVAPGSPASRAGIEPGDAVVGLAAADGATLASGASAQEVSVFIEAHQNGSIVFSLERSGQEYNLLAKPEDGFAPGRKAVGIGMDDIGTLRLSPPAALAQGALLAEEMTRQTALGLGGFFGSLLRGGADWSQVSGPIGIAHLGGAAVRQGWSDALLLTALISINLALINLVPIPGLDGGKLLFIALEAIRRRALPEKVANRLTLVGMALLLALILLASWHDVTRLINFS